MQNSFFKRCVLAAIAAGFVTCAFAEDAPVYDVDTYPPQFDGQQPEGMGPPPAGPRSGNNPEMMGGPPAPPAERPVEQGSMSQRLARLEQQMNNMQSSDSNAKLNDMQAQVQTLRGQVDQLTHQVQELQTQQRKSSVVAAKPAASAFAPTTANDDTVSDTTTAAATDDSAKAKPKLTKTTTVTKTPVSQPNVAEEQQIYQTAYSLIKAKKYNDAATTLQSMLQKYPSGQFAGNAHYWLGQLYSLMGKNDQAVSEFTIVVKNYPDYPKLSDAQLKLGLAYASLLKWSDAKSAFKKVINTYPGTTSAHLASEQLKQIKQSGH